MIKESNGNISRFTEEQFVNMLLIYLSKKGIRKINEIELARKLYPYYINAIYKDVFQEVALVKYGQSVDITKGMYLEKYFSGNVKWNSHNPSNLMLCYGLYPEDLFERQKSEISQDILGLMEKIASDFAVRYKMETENTNIYGYNPNRNYSLVSGIRHRDKYEHILITDGNIKSINNPEFNLESLYPDPTERCEAQAYRSANYKNVILENATYAILQGLCNDKLMRCSIHSEETDLEKLKSISETSHQVNVDNAVDLSSEKPYVKKLRLY